MFNELSHEIADVRTALKALEKRVDTVERLAANDAWKREELSEPASLQKDAILVCDPTVVPLEITRGPVLLRKFQPADHYIEVPTAKVENNSALNFEQSKQINGAAPSLAYTHGTVPAHSTGFFKASTKVENLSANSNSSKEGLEVFVGRNLNKLGISFLVIGCALALVYQFQFFAPVLKILSGLIVGVLLIWGGEKFEKNNAKMDWYGRALIGGGWALSYFSIFAAHYFESVRTIESPIVDVALLFAVASGAIFHSLKYKSETITGITLTLAFATICLSPATSFSVLACAMLVAVLVGLCFKMNWFNLFVYGECIFYAVYLTFILPQIMHGQNALFGMSYADGNFFTAVACSVFCWMAMNLVVFTTKDLSASDRNRLVVASLINCAAFVPSVLILMTGAHESMKFGFLLTVGMAYLISTMTANKSVKSGPMACNRILGLALVTMAVPLKFTGDWMTVFWSLEVPVLVWAGLHYQIPSVRKFAWVLASYAAILSIGTVLFPAISNLHSLLVGILSVTAYGVTAVLYEEHRAKNNLTDRFAFHIYLTFCAMISTAMLSTPLVHSWLCPGFILECVLTIILGFKLADKSLRRAGEIAIFLVGIPLFSGAVGDSSRLGVFLLVPALLYLSNEYRKVEGDEPFLQTGFQASAAAVFAVVLSQWFTGFTLEVMFAFETLAIFTYGFIIRDKSVRIIAFLASAFIALKFLIFDLNDVASIQLFGQTLNIALLYGLVCAGTLMTTSAMYLSERLRSYSGDKWEVGFYGHAALTAMVIGALTQTQVPMHWLSIAVTAEGISVLTLGFKYQNKVLRVSGLLVLALAIARLLFVELASIQTIYRILSFIGAGLVLLVASLAYAKMSNETAITKS